MAVFILAYKEMVTRIKTLLIWMFPLSLHFKFYRMVLPLYHFNRNLIVSNNILGFFCRLIRFYFITVYTEVSMHIKATIVAYAFLVQHFEKATIVAYAGLRVKYFEKNLAPCLTEVCLSSHYSDLCLFSAMF